MIVIVAALKSFRKLRKDLLIDLPLERSMECCVASVQLGDLVIQGNLVTFIGIMVQAAAGYM